MIEILGNIPLESFWKDHRNYKIITTIVGTSRMINAITITTPIIILSPSPARFVGF